MRQVKVTAVSKVAQRIALIACVAILGVGATACGSSGNVTPKAPTPTTARSTVTTPPTTAPPTTAPKSGGAGF
jgi:hypothetical protein